MNTYEVFTLKPEHITLLTNSYVSWETRNMGAPCINSKRPYGNSDVPRDIAELIHYGKKENEYGEIEFSDADYLYLYQLHFETQYALDIILHTKSFKAGLYVTKHLFHEWQLSDEASLPSGKLIDLNAQINETLSQSFGVDKLDLIKELEQLDLDGAELSQLECDVLEKMLQRRKAQLKAEEERKIDVLIQAYLIED